MLLLPMFLLLGVSSTYAAPNDHGPAVVDIRQPLHDKCIEKFPVTDEDISQVQTGQFNDDDVRMKEYILCLWISCGMMDMATFRLNNILLKVYVPETVNGGKGPDMYLECATRGRNLPTGTPLRERTWVMMKCVQETDPEHFVMF